MLMRAHEWLGTCARGRWPVGPPDDCLSAAQSAASPTGSIPPRPRRNRQTGIRPATRSDGPGFDSALTLYITASVLPLGAVRRDRQRHVPVTRRAGTLCTLSRADRRPRRLRGHGEAVWRISWPPAVRDEPVHRGRPCRQAGARGTPFRGSRGSDPVTARSRGRLRGGRSRLQNGGQVRTWAMLPRSGPFGHALVRIKSGRKPIFTDLKSH